MRNLQKSVLSTMLALSVLGSSAFALTPDASGEGAADTADTEQVAVATQTTQDNAADTEETAQQTEDTQSVSVQAKSEEETAVNKVVYAKEDLNVHSGPGTKYSVLGTLSKGQKVKAIAINGYWYKINYKGQYGYISISYTTEDPDEQNPGSEETEINKYVVATETINIHSGPSTKKSVIGTLEKGETAHAHAEVNGWYKIDYKGGYGYISASYTKDDPNADRPIYEDTTIDKTVETTADLHVRTAPNTSAKILGTLKKGTKVKAIAITKDNKWYKIKYNGENGYIDVDYTTEKLNPDKPTTEETKINKTVSTTADLNVHAGPGTKYTVLGTLAKGTKVKAIAVTKDGDWYKINYKNDYGYINVSYTTEKPNPDQPSVTPLKKTVKVTARVLRIRKGPDSSYATMGTLRKGEKAYVTGVCGDWYQIKLSHDVGYISKAYTRDLYKQVRVTANKLYVRSGAGKKYSVIGTLKKGAKVRVAATKGSWYKIVYGNGYGYIKSKYTK